MRQLNALLRSAPSRIGRRFAQIVKLKPEFEQQYKQCHANVWPEVLKQIRDGQPTGDSKRDALVGFVRKLAQSSGTVSDEDFAAIKAAGYSDAQLVEISLAFATTVFTNVFNRINDTEIDFPAVA